MLLFSIPLCIWKKTYSITSSCNPCFRWSACSCFQKEWCYYIFYTLLLTLHCSDKSNTPAKIFRHHFYELCHVFKNYYHIFIDGSKEGNRVAAAVVHRDSTKCVRLPDTASIFRAELYALLLAIDVVWCSKEKNFVIFSDSMSSLQSIYSFNLDSDLV